jgi:Zinc-finger of nitric oxide synthase-interacting protein
LSWATSLAQLSGAPAWIHHPACAGYKEKKASGMERLPFNCCSLSFTPFEDPVCTEDGSVFDISNIVPYINKQHTHPVTGEPLDLEQLIPLTFHKNGEGEYECPVMKKVFNQVRWCTIQQLGNQCKHTTPSQWSLHIASQIVILP